MVDVLNFKNKANDNESGTNHVVKILKLVTREELIGFWSYDNDNERSFLTNPLMIMIQPVMDGSGKANFSLHFLDYMPYSKNREFVFGDEHVLNISDPVDDLEKQYRSYFSGLILPTKPQLLV